MQEKDSSNLLFTSFSKLWTNLFNESWYIFGGSLLSALMLLPHGMPFLASAIIEKTLLFGFLYSSLQTPYLKIGESFLWMFSDLDNKKDEINCSHTQRILTFFIAYNLLNFGVFSELFIKSLLTLNLLANPLINGVIGILIFSTLFELIDILADSILLGINIQNISKAFSTKGDASSTTKIILSLALGVLMIGFLNPALINPFVSATLLDGMLKLTVVSLLSYFPGAILVNIIKDLIDFASRNISPFWTYNDKDEIEFKEDTILGEICGEIKGLSCTIYEAYQNTTIIPPLQPKEEELTTNYSRP